MTTVYLVCDNVGLPLGAFSSQERGEAYREKLDRKYQTKNLDLWGLIPMEVDVELEFEEES